MLQPGGGRGMASTWRENAPMRVVRPKMRLSSCLWASARLTCVRCNLAAHSARHQCGTTFVVLTIVNTSSLDRSGASFRSGKQHTDCIWLLCLLDVAIELYLERLQSNIANILQLLLKRCAERWTTEFLGDVVLDLLLIVKICIIRQTILSDFFRSVLRRSRHDRKLS